MFWPISCFIICFKTLHALPVSLWCCTRSTLYVQIRSTLFFHIIDFSVPPKASLRRMCCDVPCALLQLTHKQNEKNKELSHAPSPSLSTEAARAWVTCWFPGQGIVAQCCSYYSPGFPPSDSCTFSSTRCSFQRPSESGKTAWWPSKQTSWGNSTHRLLLKIPGNS